MGDKDLRREVAELRRDIALLWAAMQGLPRLGADTPTPVRQAGYPGLSRFASHEDHAHAHGSQDGGGLHALATAGDSGFMSALQFAQLAQLVTLNVSSLAQNRPRNLLFVGPPLDPAVVPNGSALAPYPEIQDAVNWAAAQPEISFRLEVAPATYGAVTIPAGKMFYAQCGVVAAGAVVPSVTMTASPGGGLPCIFKGLTVSTLVNVVGAAPTHQAILVFLESGNVPAVTNTGGVQAALIGIGAPEPGSMIQSITFSAPINLGDGFFVGDRVDIRQAVTCGIYSTIDSRNPAAINCSGTLIEIAEAEGPGAIAAGSVYTFTGPAGTLDLDPVSTLAFGLAGGNLINGVPTPTATGPQLLFRDSAFSAFDSAVPSTAGHMQLAAGTDAGSTYGIVYPAGALGTLGLLWRSAQRIPASPGAGAGVYFRDPTTGGAILGSPSSLAQRIGLSDGGTLFVDIDRGADLSTGVGLAWLTGDPALILGNFFPQEFIGFGQRDHSRSDPAECHPYCADRNLILDRFKLRQTIPTATAVTLELYVGRLDTPGSFVASGVTIFVGVGVFEVEDNSQTLLLTEGDAVLLYNTDPAIGWTPEYLELYARRRPL